jgi:hypothetical protein
VIVPAGGAVTLSLRLSAAAGAAERDRQGVVTLESGDRRLRLPWWGRVERVRLAAEPVRTLRPGWTSGDTRQGQRRVRAYRWPEDPRGWGLPRFYPGPEQVFSFRVPPGARNAGVLVTGGHGVPQILLGDDENLLGGPTALPLALNPYLDRFGVGEPVSGLLLPDPGRYFVVVETPSGARPGPYRLRLWVDDRTPPSVRLLTQRVGAGGRLRVAVRDAGSGVSFADLRMAIDGKDRRFRYDPNADLVEVPVGAAGPGRHVLRVMVSDVQETKNSENAAASGLPNTRVVTTSFVVG